MAGAYRGARHRAVKHARAIDALDRPRILGADEDDAGSAGEEWLDHADRGIVRGRGGEHMVHRRIDMNGAGHQLLREGDARPQQGADSEGAGWKLQRIIVLQGQSGSANYLSAAPLLWAEERDVPNIGSGAVRYQGCAEFGAPRGRSGDRLSIVSDFAAPENVAVAVRLPSTSCVHSIGAGGVQRIPSGTDENP